MTRRPANPCHTLPPLSPDEHVAPTGSVTTEACHHPWLGGGLACSGDRSLGRGLPRLDAGLVLDADASNLCNAPAVDAGGGLTQGLLAWYRCEPTAAGSSLLSDGTGHGNDGALVSATGSVSGFSYGTGKVGQAVYFSASNQGYATLPSGLLSTACEATVATWVYVTNAHDWQRVFDFGRPESNGTADVYMYLTTQDATNKGLHFAISTTGPGGGEQTMEGPALTSNVWHHVAVVLGTTGGALYLDGAQVAAAPGLTLRPIDLPHPLDYLIGRSQWRLYDYFFDGAIDELRVYSRALTPQEIQALATGS
jgi:hypothetical protein